MKRTRASSALALLALLSAAGAAAFALEIDTQSHRLAPNAVNAGGGSGSSTSSQFVFGAGEGAVSSASFTSSNLYPGLMSLASFPGTVTNLSAVAASSVAARASWSAPGYDGGLGALQPGSSYYIQFSSDVNQTWAYSGAQVIRATSAVNPGDAQGVLVSGLQPNTTTFFRLWTLDAQGDLSALSNGATVATLALPPAPGSQPYRMVGVSSVTAAWGTFAASPSSMTAEGYVLQASTAADFSGTILSSSTPNAALSTLTVTGLFSNTTYYFRAGALNWAGIANYALAGSTLTQISPDVTPPSAVADLAASTWSATSALLTWSAPSDPDNIPLSGTYAVQYATYTAGLAFSTASAQVLVSTLNVTAGAAQGLVVSGLSANTTYFFRLWTADSKPNWSALSNGATAATLANAVASAQVLSLSTGTATAGWAALPAAPSSATAEGYRLEVSSTNFGALAPGGLVYSSATASVLASTLTVSGLDPNTTYYYRVASLNWAQAPNYATVAASATWANPPTALTPAFLGVFNTSATAQWAALPVSPSTATSEGYRLEASSTNFGALSPGGLVYSSATTSVLASTLTVSALAPNTTYFFRVASLNWGATPDFTTLSATSTLADPPASPAPAQVYTTSATVSWAAPATGAEGYALLASSTNFGALAPGGRVYSTFAYDGTLLGLSVTGLDPNTTYYFLAGTLNWNGVPTYAAAGSSVTLANPPTRLASDFFALYASSAAAQWAALPVSPSTATSEGYRLEASSTNFGALSPGGLVYSSATTSVLASTLAVSALAPNTTYFFRVASLNWGATPDFTTLSATSTLANAPVSVASTYTAVAATSLTAQWSANGDPAWTQFVLQFSTAANFSGTIFSSTAPGTSSTVSGLTPNTVYYGQVQALNNGGVSTPFVSLGSTETAAAQPAAASPAFAPVYTSSLTVNFTAGSPANPAGSFYLVQLSSFSNFSAVYSSNTANLSATFAALAPNTTYFGQVQGLNGLGVATAFTALGSSPTLAAAPGPVVSTYSAVAADGFTMIWSSGALATGYNPSGTTYQAQASTAPNFTGTLTQVVATSTQATFAGLVSGTLYYTRVRALNFQSIPSSFTAYGSVTTLNSSKPVFLNGSILVSDSLGVFSAPSVYTDTTTPIITASVQSNFAPGLAVADTPSHLALWHLDDGAGASALDSSRHNNTLSLNGAPAWTSGLLGGALQFSGAQSALSPALTSWRSSAANNQFSVGLWFKATVGNGFLCQVANSAAQGAATAFDAELTWDDNSGNLDFVVYDNAGVPVQHILSAAQPYTDGLWHYAAGVVATGGAVLYVDGAQAAADATLTSANARTYAAAPFFWVGAANVVDIDAASTFALGNGVSFSAATIDEVLVTTVALTAQQVAAYYAVNLSSHALGAPSVDVSTSAGAAWTRISTNSFALSGLNGTTVSQLFTSTFSKLAPLFVQTASPGASTDQIMLIASSLDANETTSQFTLLVDTTPPAAPSYTALLNPTTFGLDLSGLSASDALSGLNASPFDLQASTDQNFGVVNQDSGWIAGPGFTFTTLLPNTTYFVRARARDAAGSQGNKSAWSASQNLATLALAPSATSFLNVFFTSATYAWAALAVSPASASAEGYQLDVSTASDFSGTVFSSRTASVLASTLTVSGLDLTTTDYFRAASLNWAGARNYAAASPLNIQIQTSTTNLSFGTIDTAISLSSVSVSSIVVTNLGNVPATVALWGAVVTQPSSPWTLAVSSGIEQPVLQGLWNSVRPASSAFANADAIAASTTTSGGIGGVYAGDQNGRAVPPGAARVIWFKFWMPTSTASTSKEIIRVDMRPIFP